MAKPPDQLMESLMGFVFKGPDGNDHIVKGGAKSRSSDPAVKAAPRYWIEADSSDSEKQAAILRIVNPAPGRSI
jgi:hypothetical protein